MLAIVKGTEYSERAGVPVEEGGPAHGADLPVAEKSTHGDGRNLVSEKVGVMVWAAIEVLTTS